MMTVFVDQIVDEIEVVAIEAVDEGQTGSMTVTEAHDAFSLEWYDARGQQLENAVSFGPRTPDGLPRCGDPCGHIGVGCRYGFGFPVFSIAQGGTDAHRAESSDGGLQRLSPCPVPTHPVPFGRAKRKRPAEVERDCVMRHDRSEEHTSELQSP